MSVLKVFVVVVLLLLVYVLGVNWSQTLDFQLFAWTYMGLKLSYVILASFALGVVATLLGMMAREWRLRRELGRLRKEHGIRERELADLRALPLQDLGAGRAEEDR